MIQDNVQYQRAEGLAQRLFEGKMLLITAHDSILHRLNEAGTFLWQCLERPRSFENLCTAIVEHFASVSQQQAEIDTRQFLKTLTEKGLIRTSPLQQS